MGVIKNKMQKIAATGILFFADRLPPLIGGMEVHANYFIKYFSNHKKFPILKVVTKNSEGQDAVLLEGSLQPIDLITLAILVKPAFIFFNSGRWIEGLESLKKLFPKTIFIYRTGGNEILKSQLNNNILEYSLRQTYWVNTLNSNIDLMVTNSAYTEERLKKIGLTCPFIRCIGGANSYELRSSKFSNNDSNIIIIFCAARFVPYKNHSLLLKVISKLIKRGHSIKLRLAGDGPLFQQTKEQSFEYGITSNVDFLGVLDNRNTCHEIAQADIYMQFSTDYVTEVQGGDYIHSEGMGRSIIEAITAGTFIIAGRSGALPEIVTKNRGLLIPLDDIEKITDEVDYVLRNMPIKLPFCDDYGWEKVFSRYEKMFEDVNEGIASN